ncbi:FKBP-type peptidyl-prolyl cis-trans isomerase [Filimonas zeae]|uniref:Peptidyl-prolyl cis-trans isomerase n=1 Tax=Filimonas zeae TaxID=1737353 RepID=A0A917IZU9_9BACT|nr:FKBP-type peptidyl-prolyl cis-trans isomerase [Filimonas zeae]MDR6338537.1 FKBP-type peptidyl-prolyl cis-trans isomerase [Filimonas zeae]GGH67766.1 hypothetical protein GCM10011379_23410 [Filimonas zeae]
MKKLLLVAAAAATFTACQVKYEKTKSGIQYKISKGKGGEKLKAGEIAKFQLTFSIPDNKDTVIKTTVGGLPGYVMVDTSARAQYTFMELMPLLSVGDSITFNLNVDSLKAKGQIQDYDNVLKKGYTLQGKVKILARFKTEQETMEDHKKEMELSKVAEVKAVEDYLAKNNIKGAQKTKNGAYVLVEVPGDQSLKADSGKQASVMYRGKLMKDGKVFDTNMDTSMHHTDPFKMVVGAGMAIPGWDEGITYFGKGGKGKIFIPSALGYGPQGSGPIPPGANLIFEVEIIDVTTPPPPAAPQGMPGMPGGAPQHGGHGH